MIRLARHLEFNEILNLHPDAAPEEIERAYLHLTTIYSENSRAAYGALSDDERRWMVKRIQEAYEALMSRAGASAEARPSSLEKKQAQNPIGAGISPGAAPVKGNGDGRWKKTGADSPNSAAESEGKADMQLSAKAVTGAHLRNIRIAKGATLDEISAATKVKKSYLEAIESDDPKRFPAPVFMKGFLKAYAKALGLNAEEISGKYLHRE